jgi:superfamily II RNA helicase
MVVICDTPFPVSDSVYMACVSDYVSADIKLSDFQKWAIKAIIEGDNVLITAHTGSGKTLPAEFAIQYFTAQKKKVIYASPIKALSNQKLYDMRRKFPHISFGILTGDCKDNPEADVLIMTTEILRNTLLNKKINKTNLEKTKDGQPVVLPLLFEMDFDHELAAVVFDEVHYINDAERGSVWEQAILLLPPQIQLIMLSATIDRPEEFAGWIETEKAVHSAERSLPVKQMYLAPTYTRVVPLTHYMWLSVNDGTIKKAAKTPYEKKLEELRRTPVPIATANGVFCEQNYYKIQDVTNHLAKNNTYVKRQFVLEDLLKYLKAKEMLPAICFVFSRKHVEQAAKEISFSLFDEESSFPTMVEYECRYILQSKLVNYKDYLELPEYAMILQLLQKGIAIHHAGIIPVLREMVELLFEKGFIRLLIATETFAVGLNMPTKTVIFAGLTKFNGSEMRPLYPHEYTQMAGRAGRRGLDTIGHVFHCVNLFELPSVVEYRHMLTGPPQKLTSKFKISFNLALSMLDANADITAFMEQSMLSMDIRKEVKGYEKEVDHAVALVVAKIEQLRLCRTPTDVLEDYKRINDSLAGLANSARKKARIELNNLETAHKFITADLTKLDALNDAQKIHQALQSGKANTANYIRMTLDDLNKILLRDEFITSTSSCAITEKGRIAAQFQEVHPLAMSDMYAILDNFESLDSTHLAGLFSCFYPVAVKDEFKAYRPSTSSQALINIIQHMSTRLDHYQKCEEDAFLNTGASYEITYDLIPYVIRWCECDDEITCKQIIQAVQTETGVFVGEFVKALLKINAIAEEFARVCESTENIRLYEKMRMIPKLTLKYIATNQSLYL